MRRFKKANRDQLLLMPPNVNDWLPLKHPARLVVSFVQQLDLGEFEKAYKDSAGRPPYDPGVMLGILLYANMRGIRSSREIERSLYEDIAFRYVAENLAPDHDTIAEFRHKHRDRLKSVFVASVQIAMSAGMVDLRHVAIDGTKVKANAAKSNRKTKEQLESELEHIRDLVGKHLDECDEVDRAEDQKFGKGNNGYLLPDDLGTEEGRKKFITDFMKQVQTNSEGASVEKSSEQKPVSSKTDQRNQKKLRKSKRSLKALEEQTEAQRAADPTGRKQRERERKRGKKDVQTVNTTDSDSRKMLFADGTFKEGYNCQIAVDDQTGVIVAALVTQDANDIQQLQPVLEQIETNTNWLPDNVSADNGYFTLEQMEDPKFKNVEFYIPPRARGAKESSDTKSERMREKLETPLGASLSAARKTIVEPVFGVLKHVRNFREMLTRGKEMVTAEWMLACTAHNLCKMFKEAWAPA